METRRVGETQTWNRKHIYLRVGNIYLRVVWFVSQINSYSCKCGLLVSWLLAKRPIILERLLHISTPPTSHTVWEILPNIGCMTDPNIGIIKIGTVQNICCIPGKTHVAQISGKVILHFLHSMLKPHKKYHRQASQVVVCLQISPPGQPNLVRLQIYKYKNV